MKIEAGKFYKTRDGKKARIYAVGESYFYSIHGAVLLEKGWSIESWRSDGRSEISTEQRNDLVSEWEEPRPRLKAWLLQCGGDGGSQADTERKGIYYIQFCVDRPTKGEDWVRAEWLDEPSEDK